MNPATAQAAPAAVIPVRPFTRASFQHVEPATLDASNAIGANTILLGPVDVPSYGFLRHVVLLVEATGGTGAAATYREDAPWCALNEVALLDTNGAPIVQVSGYDLFLINKYGGYVGFSDPASSPFYVAPAVTGNFSFILRVPVELGSRDGVGSLPNMNSAGTFKLRIVQEANTNIYAVNPTGAPSMRVRAFAEEWAPPMPQAAEGAAQATQPPALNTTGFWSYQTFNIASGSNTVRLGRVGNVIRNLFLVFRTTSPSRSTTNYPDPMSLSIDSIPILSNEPRGYRQHLMRERLVGQTNGPDTGVFVYDFTSDMDGLYGGEMRDLWLPTKSSSRLEFVGSFGAAGTLRVLTNDIAIVGDPYLG